MKYKYAIAMIFSEGILSYMVCWVGIRLNYILLKNEAACKIGNELYEIEPMMP